MSHFLESKKIIAVLWILGGLIALLLVFGLGIAVGMNRARFADGFEKNYYQNFLGMPQGDQGMSFTGGPPMSTHGTVGAVIDVSTSTISVKDQDNNERSIAVSSGTVIRDGNNTVAISDVQIGDQITVIGDPDDQGHIQARFIRVFATSTPVAQ
jgi:hypothetical protein